jgi:hypothetical protein
VESSGNSLKKKAFNDAQIKKYKKLTKLPEGLKNEKIQEFNLKPF